MGRAVRGGAVPLRTAAVLAVAVAALAGCGGGSAADRSAGGGAGPVIPTPGPSTGPGSATPTTAAGEPSEPALASPAATAGELGPADLPAAGSLGGTWTPYVDPGDAEDGYLGSGAWTRARDVDELLPALTPIGCTGLTGPVRLPRPELALEGTYGDGRGGHGVSLRLRFGTEAPARAFLTALRDVVPRCPRPERTPAPDEPPVQWMTAAATTGPDAVADVRYEAGRDASPYAWTEVVVRVGRDVGMLTVGTEAGRPLADPAALEAALRAALR